MNARSYIGAGDSSKNDVINTPLKAVDGIIGVVMMLAYYAGGTNIFPDGVDPDDYVEKLPDGSIATDDRLLCKLIEDCSNVIGRHVKSITLGSMKAYLSWLRNGKRPGKNDVEILAVNTSYDKEGFLTINPRYFSDDVEMGLFVLPAVPDWIRFIAEQRNLCTPMRA